MKIIVGLGNIGRQYEKTRHNVGFMVLDEFVREITRDGEIKGKREDKFKSIIAKTEYKGKELLLVKPTTLMNLSGRAVSKIVNFYKAAQSDLIIIYDDIDLPLGEIRIREKGSVGTHNGMRSVVEELGDQNFHRIRIGIESRGVHAPEHQDLSNFVLSDFNEKEIPIITKAIKEATQELKNLIELTS